MIFLSAFITYLLAAYHFETTSCGGGSPLPMPPMDPKLVCSMTMAIAQQCQMGLNCIIMPWSCMAPKTTTTTTTTTTPPPTTAPPPPPSPPPTASHSTTTTTKPPTTVQHSKPPPTSEPPKITTREPSRPPHTTEPHSKAPIQITTEAPKSSHKPSSHPSTIQPIVVISTLKPAVTTVKAT